MRLIKPSIEFMNMTENPLKAIELAGRTCYKSEEKIKADSAKTFVKMLLSRGHEAMIEHASMSYRIVCDRGVTHEIVRHRMFSFAQESTRYCNYKGGVEFIIPSWFDDDKGQLAGEFVSQEQCPFEAETAEHAWWISMLNAETTYQFMLNKGWKPQHGRSVLPNSLKTEIVVTGNLREWRHFFKLRCAKASHPQMREVALMLLDDVQKRIDVVFDTDFAE